MTQRGRQAGREDVINMKWGWKGSHFSVQKSGKHYLGVAELCVHTYVCTPTYVWKMPCVVWWCQAHSRKHKSLGKLLPKLMTNPYSKNCLKCGKNLSKDRNWRQPNADLTKSNELRLVTNSRQSPPYRTAKATPPRQSEVPALLGQIGVHPFRVFWLCLRGRDKNFEQWLGFYAVCDVKSHSFNVEIPTEVLNGKSVYVLNSSHCSDSDKPLEKRVASLFLVYSDQLHCEIFLISGTITGNFSSDENIYSLVFVLLQHFMLAKNYLRGIFAHLITVIKALSLCDPQRLLVPTVSCFLPCFFLYSYLESLKMVQCLP